MINSEAGKGTTVTFTLKLGKSAIAENGKVAVEILKNESFPLVFMDVQMPVMDGLTATKIIRNELAYEGIIIGLSANAFQVDEDNGLNAGMDYYLSKPVKMKKN